MESEEVENIAPEPEAEECPDDSQTAPKSMEYQIFFLFLFLNNLYLLFILYGI